MVGLSTVHISPELRGHIFEQMQGAYPNEGGGFLLGDFGAFGGSAGPCWSSRREGWVDFVMMSFDRARDVIVGNGHWVRFHFFLLRSRTFHVADDDGLGDRLHDFARLRAWLGLNLWL